MSAPRKGGGHSRGQTMPYSIVWTWASGGSGRTPKWTMGAATEGMRTMLLTSNWRESELDVRIIDRATGETVATPQRCGVCQDRWATEYGSTWSADTPSLCAECEEDNTPADETVTPGAAAPLVAALRAKGLEPVARQDGAVAVTANGINWTMRPEPHAVTGGPCGVWSAVGPAGSRGMFGASNAAEFVAHRTTP